MKRRGSVCTLGECLAVDNQLYKIKCFENKKLYLLFCAGRVVVWPW